MLRKYKEEDISQIVELEMSTLGTSLGTEMLHNELSNPMSYFYVFEEENQIIGYISLSFDGYQGEILNFCVAKEYQGKGIGTKLICYGMDMLYQKGAESFILEVRESNQNAIKLYTKLGFKQISIRKNYYSNGENALVLLKQMVLVNDIEDAFIEVYCKRENYEEYTKFTNDKNPSKYYNNFYRVKNEKIMKALYHRPGFVQFELDKPYTGNLVFHAKENLVFYHTNLYNIELKRNAEANCYMATNESREKLEAILYADALVYGEAYAKDNMKCLVEASLDRNKNTWYIIESMGMFVGFLCVFIYQDAAKIEDFVIQNSFQRQGFGTTLLRFVLKDLSEKGIHDIFLCADMDDTPKYMYEAMGFKKVCNKYVVREVFK